MIFLQCVSRFFLYFIMPLSLKHSYFLLHHAAPSPFRPPFAHSSQTCRWKCVSKETLFTYLRILQTQSTTSISFKPVPSPTTPEVCGPLVLRGRGADTLARDCWWSVVGRGRVSHFKGRRRERFVEDLKPVRQAGAFYHLSQSEGAQGSWSWSHPVQPLLQRSNGQMDGRIDRCMVPPNITDQILCEHVFFSKLVSF